MHQSWLHVSPLNLCNSTISVCIVQYSAHLVKKRRENMCRKIVEHFYFDSTSTLEHRLELSLCFKEHKSTNESNIRQMCKSNFPGQMRKEEYNHNSCMHNTLAHTAQVINHSDAQSHIHADSCMLLIVLIFSRHLWDDGHFKRNTSTFGETFLSGNLPTVSSLPG